MMNVGRADNLTGIQEPENYEAGTPSIFRRNAGAGERSAEDEKKQDETEVRG